MAKKRTKADNAQRQANQLEKRAGCATSRAFREVASLNPRHDPIPLYLNPADGASPGLPRFTQRRGFHPLNSFSSHFSRTVITDPHHNRCEHCSTVRHREIRPSPETNAFPAIFPPLFDNIWQRRAPQQVHAKSQNLPLSPIF